MKSQPVISILIIEDNLGDQLLLHENLKATRLPISEIETASTLAGALKLLQQRSFSLIFLDLFLPDSTGLESFTELIKVNSKIPVIIYSGFDDEQVALKAISLGAQDFLIKADYTDKLLEKIIKYSIERKHNSDALEESNERLALISKATHDMVWDWNLLTDNVERNAEGWKKIFKTTDGSEAGIKENWTSRVLPIDREKAGKVINELIKSDTQELFEVEFRIFRDDDTIGYIEDRGYIIRNEYGKAVRIIGASHDITERKNAEEKVLLSEQRFKSLVQNSSDLFGILNAEGNYIYASASTKQLGFDPEFFIGKNAFALIHEDDLQKSLECMHAIATQKRIEVPLFRLKNSSGEWRWIERTMTNMLDNPAVGGIVINSRDVTEKKIADDELLKLSMIARETINGVIITDENEKILWVNNAFSKLSGYGLEEIMGRTPMDFLKGEETDMSLQDYITEQRAKKIPYVFEILNYSKSKEKFFVRVQVQPIFNEQGEVKQYFAMQTDITQEKYLEEEAALEKIVKLKEITEAVITAHENERSEIGRELHDNVNQLLAASKLYNDMGRTNKENRDDLLLSSSNYTMKAIEEIRKLSKTLITPLIKETGLIESVNNLAADIMAVHPVVITFSVKDFEEEILNEKFKLNIYRIVQEQVNNTLKHAHAKTIKIDMSQTPDKLFIAISDDGVGFDTSIKKKGIGISNIISRAELYKGDVKINSAQCEGCSLFISFIKTNLLLK